LALEMLRKEMPDLTSSEVLMVGDSIERDIAPAKKLGLKTALSEYGQRKIETGNPDYELTDIKDILRIMRAPKRHAVIGNRKARSIQVP